MLDLGGEEKRRILMARIQSNRMLNDEGLTAESANYTAEEAKV